ncbi:class IV adenylate cyclase [Actinoplanes sp. NPDC051861]|uniref:class IV adenylate cyclase n=1 Tax=Actinoplanes sp. NPDC051861 TaxID=3155170 RepID=UPI00343E78A4
MTAEIEVKYRVLDVDALLAALERHGIALSAPTVQDDQAYAPATWQDGDSRIGVTFARLRHQSGRCLFTTKTPVDNALACVENETEVADPGQMHRALLAMGYRPTVRVLKTRRTGKVGDWSLCLDDLSGKGAFLEVEAVTDGEHPLVQVQDQLDQWVLGLGVRLERTGATYDEVVSRSAASA